MGPRRDSGIDGLRGLAALMVVASHASNLGLHLIPGLSLAGIGKYGVYLFFVISAFLLTRQWLEHPKPSVHLVWPYLVRRVARIYPLYAVVLLVGWALAPRGLGVTLDGEDVWRHLTLRAGFDIYWSVPVEFSYYLVIPLVAAWWRVRMPEGLRLVGWLLLCLVVLLLWPAAEAPENSITLGYYLPVFLCGSWAAVWAASRYEHGRPEGGVKAGLARLGPWDVAVAALVLLTVPSVLEALLGGVVRPDSLHRQFLAWGLAWAGVLLLLISGRLPLWSTMLGWHGLRRCGQWCFGLYLLHMPCLLVARKLPLPEPAAAWVGVLAAVAASAVAWCVIEQPSLRAVARWLQPLEDKRPAR